MESEEGARGEGEGAGAGAGGGPAQDHVAGKLDDPFRQELARLCDVYERATEHTVGLHLVVLGGDEHHEYAWNGESMNPVTRSHMHRIGVTQDLCFEMLSTLRLAYIYALMGSKIESELGEDFKPWKWGTESVREFAQGASHQYAQLIAQMGDQVRPPSDAEEKLARLRSRGWDVADDGDPYQIT